MIDASAISLTASAGLMNYRQLLKHLLQLAAHVTDIIARA